jgi:hypothetical protein
MLPKRDQYVDRTAIESQQAPPLQLPGHSEKHSHSKQEEHKEIKRNQLHIPSPLQIVNKGAITTILSLPV